MIIKESRVLGRVKLVRCRMKFSMRELERFEKGARGKRAKQKKWCDNFIAYQMLPKARSRFKRGFRYSGFWEKHLFNRKRKWYV